MATEGKNMENTNCHCACNVCYCGPNCKCSESLCQCEASSVLNSLSRTSSALSRTEGGDPLSSPSSIEEIGVSGMTCSNCVNAVERGLKSLEGVKSANCSLATQSVRVEYDSAKLKKEDFLDLIEAIGYDPIVPEASAAVVEFAVSGMTCSMCTRAIENGLSEVNGVIDVSVSLPSNTARVKYDSSLVEPNVLKAEIENLGYDCSLISGSQEDESQDRLEILLQQQQKQVSNQKRSFYASLAGAFPILVITMIIPHTPLHGVQAFLQRDVQIGRSKLVVESLILFALCTPVQFVCGWPFYKQSYYGLRRGILGMDVLVAVGTTSSYGYALWATIVGSIEYHFFETSAVLICFVLLGKLLQSLAVRRTSAALTKLLGLQPKTAIKITTSLEELNPAEKPYHEEVVSVQSIKPGDVVKVLKGASIPADGVVRFGEMSVDESMITGESIPVLKTQGSIVLGGTICAESGQSLGAAFVDVTGVGSSTALSQIVTLVQDAQNRNREVPIQNLADSISSVFVPTVVAISTVTFMVWYALIQGEMVPKSYLPAGESPATFSLLFAISCLVISCPCALGLATPTAILVGTGVGANQGILFKGGETLEMASRVDSVVFDKTGTLTKGEPVVTDFQLMVDDDAFWGIIEDRSELPVTAMKDCLLWLLGSLERNSEHPLASAVVAFAEEHLSSKLQFEQPANFSALTGRGASGSIKGRIKVAVGNRVFAELEGVTISRQVEDVMQRLERQGKTAILCTVNSSVCVVMGIADEVKPDAATSVKYLKEKMGVDVWIVTGDNRRTARAIARQLELPMERVVAEALPVAKVEQVQKLQEEGRIVAMVGDGVNDSPALVQANVGLSLGTGAEIAAEASDMVLVRGNVVDVCTALDLSRVIFRRIRLNFVWSLLYNCLSIPLAAGVFYPLLHARLPPTAAALAMALSSVSVVLSSLALRLYQPPQITEDPMVQQTRASNTDSLMEPLLPHGAQGREDEDDTSDLHRIEEGQM